MAVKKKKNQPQPQPTTHNNNSNNNNYNNNDQEGEVAYDDENCSFMTKKSLLQTVIISGLLTPEHTYRCYIVQVSKNLS